MATPSPGFDSPAVGFEQPFDMLEACHERVRRSLSLLERLIAHIVERLPASGPMRGVICSAAP